MYSNGKTYFLQLDTALTSNTQPSTERPPEPPTKSSIDFTVACANGQIDMVMYHVEVGGEDIHIRGDQALMFAAQNGHLNVIKYLIANGANVYSRRGKVLQQAIEHGHINVVRYLVENTGLIIPSKTMRENDIWYGIFTGIVKWGHMEIMKYFVDILGVDMWDYRKRLVKMAVRGGDIEMTRYILGHVGGIRDFLERTLYHLLNIGIVKGIEMVKYLIEEVGLDPHMVHYDSHVGILLTAATHGSLEVFKYLVEEKGVRSNNKDDSPDEILRYAVVESNIEVAKYVLEKYKDEINPKIAKEVKLSVSGGNFRDLVKLWRIREYIDDDDDLTCDDVIETLD